MILGCFFLWTMPITYRCLYYTSILLHCMTYQALKTHALLTGYTITWVWIECYFINFLIDAWYHAKISRNILKLIFVDYGLLFLRVAPSSTTFYWCSDGSIECINENWQWWQWWKLLDYQCSYQQVNHHKEETKRKNKAGLQYIVFLALCIFCVSF